MSFEPEVINVQNLVKSYRIFRHAGDRLKQALTLGLRRFHDNYIAINGVTFSIRRGETVGIIGLNGSGKSTLLQLICGILKPTQGRVQVHGRIAALLELGAGFNPELTGRENVFFQGTMAGMSRSRIQQRFDEIAEFAGIGDFIEQPLRTYSSGMAMRLALASSIYTDPDILIVDEALSVGDAGFQFKCYERMKQLANSGKTILFVSHDTAVIKSFCDRVIYLVDGQIKMTGTPDIVVEQYYMDIHQEQALTDLSIDRIEPNRSVSGRPEGVAFGTSQGNIISACFEPSGLTSLTIKGQTTVCIYVEMEYRADLTCLALRVLLQDQRLIPVSGRDFPVSSYEYNDDRAVAHMRIEFSVDLAPATYFISLRLQMVSADGQIRVLDKQSGALSITTVAAGQDFFGMLNVGMKRVDKQVD